MNKLSLVLSFRRRRRRRLDLPTQATAFELNDHADNHNHNSSGNTTAQSKVTTHESEIEISDDIWHLLSWPAGELASTSWLVGSQLKLATLDAC